ncbi:alpha-amylase family glycosyl hydrolase [Rhizobium sp. PP-F2F-G48]|uniref:alpha-amylase family glycosyl hydrolase n=1 Tax=Rhizobium sp. PP-F2F-G48 TaxID=2135651 RepID=UPI001FDFFA0A|nr:alpha-amylase family glycosyl hydrolase [Rhizobium sp. PP-F2F-G48]
MDGFEVFRAEITFPEDQAGTTFRWGVLLDGPAGRDLWAISAEVDDEQSFARERSFVLGSDAPEQIYALTWCDRLGAVRLPAVGGRSGIRFSVWAPNARSMDLVLADPAVGYIADDGTGTVRTIPMRQAGEIWTAGPEADPMLADFDAMVGTPYMYRITKDDGSSAYRTDLWSLMQIGAGDVDPKGAVYAGTPEALDGPQSCSVVCDPRVVALGSGQIVSAEDFWSDEFPPGISIETRLEDLVIYELHVGALGFGKPDAGTLDDAIAFLDHLTTLGVNAVELMPIAEFETRRNWGYGTSHFLAMDQWAGGTDRLKMFVKACHQRGIVVILDVCYNHFSPDAERVQWAFDSNDHPRNIYYWYEGRPEDYQDPLGGYVDNLSTGWAPRYDEEAVRQLFISSAAFLATVCHIDGFRLDQTSSIHQYPVFHSDNDRRVERAAAFGVKFLKQWTRTMRLAKPGLFLTAEDYSDWPALTEPSLEGDGLGFDATWYGDFHHGLMEHENSPHAHLVQEAGYGDGRALAMSAFAGALASSSRAKVVYNQSHDDCGNRKGSARTLPLAVNFAPLVGETRRWAEARARFAAAVTLLSAGTPMFFMGEEIGAIKPYRYDDFVQHREDITGEAIGDGAQLFRYYKDLVGLSKGSGAIRSRNIAVSATHDANRVLAFHRWDETDAFFVVGSLADAPFASGYWLSDKRIGDGEWVEVFNSDAEAYGGWNIGNGSRTLRAEGCALNVVLPSSGIVVLKRVSGP